MRPDEILLTEQYMIWPRSSGFISKVGHNTQQSIGHRLVNLLLPILSMQVKFQSTFNFMQNKVA